VSLWCYDAQKKHELDSRFVTREAKVQILGVALDLITLTLAEISSSSDLH
jgi:hypothetical protein